MKKCERRAGRLRAQVRDLQRRVHAIELQHEADAAGPPLTLEALVGDYQKLRRAAVRQVKLRCAPDVQETAWRVVGEGSFRALGTIEIDDALPRGAWELVPA